jgi:probable phosphoglycerate mutase
LTQVVVEADGGSRGNPGPAGYGAVVLDADDQVLAERSDAIGVDTNNVAEYRGLIAGLQAAAELGARVVHVRMDSKLVVEQMSGNWRVTKAHLRPLASEANALRAAFDQVTFEWIPRARNTRADRLANEAMDRAAGITRSVRTAPSAPRSTEETPTQQALWTPPADTATRLILLRHGATEHSIDRRFSGRNDLPLTEFGMRQAAELAARMATGAEVAAVLSSPLLRARQTAQPIADALGTSVEVVDGLAEVDFGEWEGLTFSDVGERYPKQRSNWLSSPQTVPPGGESFAELGLRVLAARDDVLAKYPASTLVLITHVTPIKVLLRDALQAPPISLFRIHLDTASVSIVDYFGDGNCSVRLVNDTSHLSRRGDGVQSRSDEA